MIVTDKRPNMISAPWSNIANRPHGLWTQCNSLERRILGGLIDEVGKNKYMHIVKLCSNAIAEKTNETG